MSNYAIRRLGVPACTKEQYKELLAKESKKSDPNNDDKKEDKKEGK